MRETLSDLRFRRPVALAGQMVKMGLYVFGITSSGESDKGSSVDSVEVVEKLSGDLAD